MELQVNNNIKMRTLTTEDAELIFAVVDANREYLGKWLPWVDKSKTSIDTRNTILSWENEYQAGTDVIFGIFYDARYVGNIGLQRMKNKNNSGMIGYWLAEKEQGKGIITNCVKAICDYGFYTLNLNRIWLTCANLNYKSQAIPERLGFTKEGVLRDNEYLNGEYYDSFMYGLLQREWSALV